MDIYFFNFTNHQVRQESQVLQTCNLLTTRKYLKHNQHMTRHNKWGGSWEAGDTVISQGNSHINIWRQNWKCFSKTSDNFCFFPLCMINYSSAFLPLMILPWVSSLLQLGEKKGRAKMSTTDMFKKSDWIIKILESNM